MSSPWRFATAARAVTALFSMAFETSSRSTHPSLNNEKQVRFRPSQYTLYEQRHEPYHTAARAISYLTNDALIRSKPCEARAPATIGRSHSILCESKGKSRCNRNHTLRQAARSQYLKPEPLARSSTLQSVLLASQRNSAGNWQAGAPALARAIFPTMARAMPYFTLQSGAMDTLPA